MGCLVALDRRILTMLSLGYQNLISLAKRVVDFDLTYSGNLYSQGAMSFVWVLIFRKDHVWAGWNCAYSWSCQVCCRASCSSCAYRYVVQISTIATKYILYYFLLEGPQNPLLSLPDTTPYSFSSIAGTLSSISSWWIVSWCFLHPLSRCPWILVLLHSNIFKSVWSSQILCSPKWKWSIK